MPVHHKKGLVEPLFGAIDWAAVDWKKKEQKIFLRGNSNSIIQVIYKYLTLHLSPKLNFIL